MEMRHDYRIEGHVHRVTYDHLCSSVGFMPRVYAAHKTGGRQNLLDLTAPSSAQNWWWWR